MGNTFYFDWEPALMIWLQQHMGTFGTFLASAASAFGEEILLIVLFGFLYWCYDKEMGVYIGTNLAISAVLNPFFKNLALRRRPYFDHPQIRCLKLVEPEADMFDIAAQGFSFPSGHSTQAASVYASLAAYVKKRWLTVLCTIIILAVGISRFCLGVHYPTDVLFGWGTGLLMVWLIPKVKALFPAKWIFYLTVIILLLPGFFFVTTNDYYTAFGLVAGFFAGNLFEEKYVRFTPSMKPMSVVLRICGGMVGYLGLNILLKIPFSKEFLESGTMLAFAVRAIRYTIILFVLVGVYPMLFRGKKELTK